MTMCALSCALPATAELVRGLDVVGRSIRSCQKIWVVTLPSLIWTSFRQE